MTILILKEMNKYPFSVISAFIYLGYDLGWSCVFIFETNQPHPSECDPLIQWDKALYIVLLFISGLHLISSIFSWYYMNTHPRLIIGFSICKSFWNFIAGILIMIGIIFTYSSLGDKIKFCGYLQIYNLIYIILEMSIISVCCVFVWGICLISQIKKWIKTKNLDKVKIEENTDLSDEEDSL